jgi:TetR/AcrR family transcriptional regulator
MTSKTNSSRSGARVPKQQRSLETQEKVLHAALSVFAERGYDGATMGGIAKRAGVGQPLVEYHFPTKEDLWVSTVEMALDGFQARLLPGLEALEGLDPATRLSRIFQDYTRYMSETPELLPVLIDMNRHGGPALDKVIKNRLRPTYERLRDLIEDAQRDGAMPAGDPGLMYYALVAVSGTLYSLTREFELVTGRDPTGPDMVEAQASLLTRLFFPGLADADGASGQ